MPIRRQHQNTTCIDVSRVCIADGALTIKGSAQDLPNQGCNQAEESNIDRSKWLIWVESCKVKRTDPLAVCWKKGAQDSTICSSDLMIRPVQFRRRQLAGEMPWETSRCIGSVVEDNCGEAGAHQTGMREVSHRFVQVQVSPIPVHVRSHSCTYRQQTVEQECGRVHGA